MTPSTITRLGHGAQLTADSFLRLMLWLNETDIRPYLLLPEKGLISHEQDQAGERRPVREA